MRGESSTPLLHKDVVESTACPHQKAASTFLPPARRASGLESLWLGESSGALFLTG